jgi:hypothetical protein
MKRNGWMVAGWLAVAACSVWAEGKGQAEEKPFPAVLPESKESMHVLFVNVAGALDRAAFADGVGKIKSLMPLNLWTNDIPKSLVKALVVKPELLKEFFGEKAAVVVFMERSEEGPSFMQVPGAWSLVNLRGLDKDQPDARTLRERTRKMFLKGLAHASGIGSNVDPHCAMWCGSFTLAGMDKTTTSLGPYAFFPMQETLKAIGGTEIFALPGM